MMGKLGVGEDSMTTMVMCARTPFFLTTLRDLRERLVRAHCQNKELSLIPVVRCWFDPHLDSSYLDSYPADYPMGDAEIAQL